MEGTQSGKSLTVNVRKENRCHEKCCRNVGKVEMLDSFPRRKGIRELQHLLNVFLYKEREGTFTLT